MVVIGHTDTVGAGELNDRLAETRAKTMQAELVRLGIDPESIKASGRGERDLKVQTPDEVKRTAQSAGLKFKCAEPWKYHWASLGPNGVLGFTAQPCPFGGGGMLRHPFHLSGN
ncbi:MAG: OmpA family protein [Betaproteobacteria bacterium]|nr:OmpA family protein [Betaproteobacteria bacterium]